MIKNLRYLLLSLLTIMSTAIFAQKTVTIDFDNDYQKLFPTLTGVSEGSGDNYVGDGDFKGVTMSTPVEGVMVTIAPDEEATNPSRIWKTAPRLRMYSGSFTVVSMLGTPITKIEFTGHDKNFNLSPVEGTLTEKVWTGSSLSPIFMVSKNTQINKIVVTLGEGGSDTPDDSNNKGGIFSKFTFTSGKFTDSENQLALDFEGFANSELPDGNKIKVVGQFLFDFENNICSTCSASLTFDYEEYASAAWVSVLASQEEDGYTDIQLDGKTLSLKSTKEFIGVSKIVIKSMLKMLLDDEQGGYGILANPMSPNQANIFAGTLEKDKVYEEDVYIKGKIASIKYEFSANYGTATFAISADGKDEFTFQCYSVYYLENKPWVEGNTQIKVGDEVIICGKVTNFKGTTPETASKQAYIYSLNGVTKNEGGSETPDTPNEITVAKALEIIAGLEDGKKTSEEYIVKGIVTAVEEISTSYGNATFDIADNAGDATVLKVYRAKDAEGQKITDENIVKVGDTVVVQGLLQKYVKNDVVTPEVAQNGKILTVNGQSTGITIIKAVQAETPLYNLAGQRVDANYKGVVIKNGQKMIQK